MDQSIQTRSLRLQQHQYRYHSHSFPSPNSLNIINGIISAKSVSNYDSPLNSPVTQRRQRPCIMCGSSDSSIPSQNKRVCKECDTCFWLWVEHQVVFKFCKGCKNFCVLDEFTDKPDNAKCCRCRERSRDWYLSKKPSAAAAVTPGPTSNLTSSKGSSLMTASSGDGDEGNQNEGGTTSVRVNNRRKRKSHTEEQAFEEADADTAEAEKEEQLQQRYGPVKKKINFSPMVTTTVCGGVIVNKISPAQHPPEHDYHDAMEEKENIPSPIKGRSDSSWEWDEKKNPLFLLASLSSERL